MATLILMLITTPVVAGEYYTLCEGNYGQANSALWSINDDLSGTEGPLVWNTSTNPLGDVGQSLTLYGHKLYIIMNNSHEIRVLNLENGPTHVGDIDVPNTSPRYMAVQPSMARAFVSSWNLAGLLIIDLSTDTVVDTCLLGGLPEQLLIDDDKLFVSMTMHLDWTANNQVLQLDISAPEPSVVESYQVIDGPGSMALTENDLFVTSLYYNDAWETFSGTSRIDLLTGDILAVDHGYYTNYTADIQIVNGTPYRPYGNTLVLLNDDLDINTSASMGDFSNMYAFVALNDHLIIGSSDFVAPDLVQVFSINGQELGSFNVGALPGDFVYYNPDVVALSDEPELPVSMILGNAYPNPFNPSTSIPFKLNVAGQTALRIYNVQGQLVKALLNSKLDQGKYKLQWNGTHSSGQLAPSGIYLAVLSTASGESVIKLNLIR